MTTKKKVKAPDRMSESPEYLRGTTKLTKCDMLPIGTCKTCTNFANVDGKSCAFGTVRGGYLPIEEDWACGDWDLKN
jgi:hypothetical protein